MPTAAPRLALAFAERGLISTRNFNGSPSGAPGLLFPRPRSRPNLDFLLRRCSDVSVECLPISALGKGIRGCCFLYYGVAFLFCLRRVFLEHHKQLRGSFSVKLSSFGGFVFGCQVATVHLILHQFRRWFFSLVGGPSG